jgi:hypothetical protein
MHAGIYKITVRTVDIVSFARVFVQKSCKNLQKLSFQPLTFLFAFFTIQAFLLFLGKTVNQGLKDFNKDKEGTLHSYQVLCV